MGRSGDVARVALLDVAERLFALHGVGGVSLREISSAAGHRNHSSVQYHFGDRAGLVAAVFERRMQVINTRRMVLLEELDANGRGLDLGGLVEASYIPAVELVCETRAWYGRFLIRTRWDPFAKDITRALPEASSVRQITRRLHRALGDELPIAVRRNRIDQLDGLLGISLAGWEWGNEQGSQRLPMELLAAELVTTGTALLRAPLMGHTNNITESSSRGST